jgi:hypothetical protein
MEQKQNKNLVKNILISVAVGIVVGMILGGLLPMLGLQLPGSTNTIGVGVAIAVTYALLNNRMAGDK